MRWLVSTYASDHNDKPNKHTRFAFTLEICLYQFYVCFHFAHFFVSRIVCPRSSTGSFCHACFYHCWNNSGFKINTYEPAWLLLYSYGYDRIQSLRLFWHPHACRVWRYLLNFGTSNFSSPVLERHETSWRRVRSTTKHRHNNNYDNDNVNNIANNTVPKINQNHNHHDNCIFYTVVCSVIVTILPVTK